MSLRNLAQSTAKAEDVAQEGLRRKRAETKAQAVWNALKAELCPEDLERVRLALIPLVLNKPKTNGVKWTPKERARAAAEKLFKTVEAA